MAEQEGTCLRLARDQPPPPLRGRSATQQRCRVGGVTAELATFALLKSFASSLPSNSRRGRIKPGHAWRQIPKDVNRTERICTSSQGERMVELTRFQRLSDGENNAVCGRQHLIIPEPQDSIAPCLQPLRARQVFGFGNRVLPTINLDDERGLRAEEITHVRADWLLASEAKTVGLYSTYSGPQANFRLGGIAAQSSCDRRCHSSILTFEALCEYPPPNPSPSRGEGRSSILVGLTYA